MTPGPLDVPVVLLDGLHSPCHRSRIRVTDLRNFTQPRNKVTFHYNDTMRERPHPVKFLEEVVPAVTFRCCLAIQQSLEKVFT